MMPTGTVAATYYFSSLHNTRMSFTWYWQPGSSIASLPQSELDNTADDAFTQLAALWNPIGDDDAMILGCQLTIQESPTAVRYGYSMAAAVAGDFMLVDSLPDNMALVIRKHTGLTGRQNRGRVFIPCISEGAVNNGYIEPGHVADVKALADYFGADQTWNGMVYHSRHWSRKDSALRVVTVALGVLRLYSKIKRLKHEFASTIH